MFDVIIDFPKMKVGVVTRDEHVVEIRYLPPSVAAKPARSPLGATAADQLERYRGNPDTRFDLPVLVEGKLATRGVGRDVRHSTRKHPNLWRYRPRPRRGRAVGQACGGNRLPIIIPCHRVVAADGIGGFSHATSGYLLEAKRWLLAHEAPAFELRP